MKENYSYRNSRKCLLIAKATEVMSDETNVKIGNIAKFLSQIVQQDVIAFIYLVFAFLVQEQIRDLLWD